MVCEGKLEADSSIEIVYTHGGCQRRPQGEGGERERN